LGIIIYMGLASPRFKCCVIVSGWHKYVLRAGEPLKIHSALDSTESEIVRAFIEYAFFIQIKLAKVAVKNSQTVYDLLPSYKKYRESPQIQSRG